MNEALENLGQTWIDFAEAVNGLGLTIKEEGSMTKSYEPIKTGYVGNLGSGDIGADIRIDVVHKYRYRGEDREKIKSFWHPTYIKHGAYGVEIYAKTREHNYWSDSITLKPLDECIVWKEVRV